MSSVFVKSKLKLARDAIAKKDFAIAREASSQVLDYEPENYTAHVFLGLALLKLLRIDESEQIYRKAITINPDQLLAWQGLVQLYEQINNRNKLLEALEHLCKLHDKSGDAAKVAELLTKIIDLCRAEDDRLKLVKALSYLLTESPYSTTLSNLPPPDLTNHSASNSIYVQTCVYNELPVLEEIVDILEQHECSEAEKEIERRRTRLGAGGPEQIRKDVKREIQAKSQLPHLYNQILNHPKASDELRRLTESKLLHFKAGYLHSLPWTSDFSELKSSLRTEVDDLIQGIILLEIPEEFAWSLYLEEQDQETMDGYDYSAFKQLICLLPKSKLSRAFIGYFRYISEPIVSEDDGEEVIKTLGIDEDEDPFDTVMNVFVTCQDSVMISRIAGEIYMQELDYENVIKASRNGLAVLDRIELNSGKQLLRTRVGLQGLLVTALVHLFPPKHHQRALPIINEALSVSPNNIRCLFGYAYIRQSAEDWSGAADLFEKIDHLLPEDIVDGLRAREESAWSRWQADHNETSIEELKIVLSLVDNIEHREHDAARCLWRIGKCLWEQGGDKRETAYVYFIDALKRDSTFAPAFTALGSYYIEVSSPPDLVRASKCFQKAFELDPRENVAAQKLAEGFAEDSEWDLVEVVARRTIEGEGGVDAGVKDSGTSVIKFIPTNAWAWKAIGIIEMDRHSYGPSIQAFQIALRAEPKDALTWTRLGEVYGKAGRHTAAIKALNYALELDPENWACLFLIGEYKYQMGLFQEAIQIFGTLLDSRPDELSILALLAQTHLSLGYMEFREGYRLRAEVSFLSTLEVAVPIIKKHPGFRGLAWKLISDATFHLSMCPFLHDRVRSDRTINLLKSLLSVEHTGPIHLPPASEFGSSESLIFLGICSHVCNLRITFSTSSGTVRGSAWYDLAVAIQLWKNKLPTLGSDTDKIIIDSITNALKEDPSNTLYWIFYGNAHFVVRPRTAQHAYIKALDLDLKNITAWTNLGFLYYHHGDLQLSSDALHRAQVIDPDYALAWLGQALVATANGHGTDAHTLLTYATTLTTSLPDIDIKYALQVFYESKIPRRRTEGESDLIPCFFALDRYCSQRPNDAAGLHLFALICEKIGHVQLAISLVTRAIAILEAIYEESENKEVERQFIIANTTLGRLALSAGECDRAIESFQSALGLLPEEEEKDITGTEESKNLRVQIYLGSALAHFIKEDYQASLDSSQAALTVAGDDLTMKGPIAVLLAQTLWALGIEDTREAAKAQLLEHIAVDPENLVAINTLASMGILTHDDNLVDAALTEVLALPINQRQELDSEREVDYLLVQHNLGEGKIDEAISIAQKEVIAEPGKIEPRLQLATLMMRKGERQGALALLIDAVSGDKDNLSSTANALALHAVAMCEEASTEEKNNSLREAQRAVMLQPSNAKSWQALAYVRSYIAN